MSKLEALQMEIAAYAKAVDEETLIVVRDILSDAKEQHASTKDWWHDTPEHIRASLIEASKRPIGEGGMTWEEVKARTRIWLHK